MHVLDLDLDLFLNEIANDKGGKDRLSDDEFDPWREADVRRFLEHNCGLSKEKPTEGAVFRNHEEVFLYWKRLIDEGSLVTPFEVVHADAHADLCSGEPSWCYLMSDFLAQEVEDRPTFMTDNEYLTGGSYLAFAIGCRWICKLSYVHHPSLSLLFGPDIPPSFMKDFDHGTQIIQLKRYNSEQVRTIGMYRPEPTPLGLEPAIPLDLIKCHDFKTTAPFSLVCLACSPAFTPKSSDALIPIIREYIVESSTLKS